MIRVMIVEDEPPTLRRIKSMIERCDPAFEVINTATDGIMALEQMVKAPCDVIITDVRMPEMDGLQLMNEIRIRYPECIVVVLSGYKEFDYVTHAMRNQAIDYLLKPVSEEDMRKLLDKVKDLYQQFCWEKKLKTLSAQLNRSIITNAFHRMNKVDLFGVFLLNLGSVLDRETSFLDPSWKHMDFSAIYEWIERFMHNNCILFCEFAGDAPSERIFVYQSSETEPSILVNRVYEEIRSVSSIPIFSAYLVEEAELTKIKDTIKGLRNQLICQARIGQSLLQPVKKNDLANVCPEKEHTDAEAVQKIYELFKTGRFSQTTPFRRELFQRFTTENWTHFRIYELLMKSISLFEIEPEKNFSRPLIQFRSDVINAVCHATSIEELENRLCSIVPLLLHRNEERERNPGNKIVHSVKKYLDDNYAQQGITTQVISEEFGYVPGYISSLFKQEFGMSPMNYLTQLRIKKAKELMGEQSDILISEVAESVGFMNQHHFSRVFKKFEGMWPSSFKS